MNAFLGDTTADIIATYATLYNDNLTQQGKMSDIAKAGIKKGDPRYDNQYAIFVAATNKMGQYANDKGINMFKPGTQEFSSTNERIVSTLHQKPIFIDPNGEAAYNAEMGISSIADPNGFKALPGTVQAAAQSMATGKAISNNMPLIIGAGAVIAAIMIFKKKK